MIDLNTFAGGKLLESVNKALGEVSENIKNIDTEAKPKRKLTVEMVFETDEEREISIVTINTKTKLAPIASAATKVIIDSDLNGELICSEYKRQVSGQTYMQIDKDTGEVFSIGSNKNE